MPMRSITARERRLASAVKETISVSPMRSKPARSAASAASLARPRPQNGRARRQPISTQGEQGRVRRGTLRPTKPMNSPLSASSAAQLLQPWVSSCACHRSMLASLAARLCSAGKNSITAGSAFIAANGARSASRQRRSRGAASRARSSPASGSGRRPRVADRQHLPLVPVGLVPVDVAVVRMDLHVDRAVHLAAKGDVPRPGCARGWRRSPPARRESRSGRSGRLRRYR